MLLRDHPGDRPSGADHQHEIGESFVLYNLQPLEYGARPGDDCERRRSKMPFFASRNRVA